MKSKQWQLGYDKGYYVTIHDQEYDPWNQSKEFLEGFEQGVEDAESDIDMEEDEEYYGAIDSYWKDTDEDFYGE